MLYSHLFYKQNINIVKMFKNISASITILQFMRLVYKHSKIVYIQKLLKSFLFKEVSE